MWDEGLASKANISVDELRAYEMIFNKLDPQSEGEINVTKFVRSGLGRNVTGLSLSSRDLRRLFSSLRQKSTAVGDPEHISLPVTPNEFLMALARPPFYRSGLLVAEISLVKQFADTVRTTAGYSIDDEAGPTPSTAMAMPPTRVATQAAPVERPPPPPPPRPAAAPPMQSGGTKHRTQPTEGSMSARKGARSGPFVVVEDPDEDKYNKSFFQNFSDSTLEQYFGKNAKPMSVYRTLALIVFISSISMLLVVYALHGASTAA